MKAAVYARILLALLCLLALATSASAEGAWVLWERTNIEPTTQRRIEAFSTQRECQTAALREARFKYYPTLVDSTAKPTTSEDLELVVRGGSLGGGQ